MKTYYLKQEVIIGEIIDFEGMKITVTSELIKNNPDKFEIKEDIPKYVEITTRGWGGSIAENGGGTIFPIDFNNKQICSIREGWDKGEFKPSTKEAYDRQELLKKAKKEYPHGTRFKSAYRGKLYTVCEVPYYNKNVENLIFTDGYAIYYKGKWAEILKPLFTTEDGVEIFEGDKYYYISLEMFKLNCDYAKFSSGNTEGIIYFSTKQAAEAYISRNRENSLKDYETILLDNGTFKYISGKPLCIKDYYIYMKLNDPKLYYTKILQLIADDLNGKFEGPKYYIKLENKLYNITFWDNFYEGGVLFSSIEIAQKAINIMGFKLNLIYK